MDEGYGARRSRPAGSGRRGVLRSASEGLRRDRLTLVGMVVFAAICLPYLLPLLSPEQLVRASEGILLSSRCRPW